MARTVKKEFADDGGPVRLRKLSNGRWTVTYDDPDVAGGPGRQMDPFRGSKEDAVRRFRQTLQDINRGIEARRGDRSDSFLDMELW